MKGADQAGLHRWNESWRGPVLGVLIVLGAFMLQSALWHAIQPYVWFLFFPAVFFSSWVGGFSGGIIGTLLSVGLVWYCFIPPRYSFSVANPTSLFSIGIFVGMGVLFSLTHRSLRLANLRVEKALAAERALKDQLEEQVKTRTAELQQAMADLQAGEERLRLALEAAHMGTFDWDIPNNRIVWSVGHEKLWGFQPGEFRGTYEDFSRPVHPEDLPGIQKAIESSLAARTPFSREYRVRWPDGSLHWVSGLGRFEYDATGAPMRMRGVVLEITERKLAEEQLRASRATLDAALSSMTDAVFIADNQGHFHHLNDAFATIHRFKNREECVRNLAEYPALLEVYFPNGDLAPLDQWAVPRALRGETVTNAEYTLRRKDTGETWVGSYSFGPIRDAGGAIAGAVVVGRDITDRKRSEQAILELNRTLERRVQERTSALRAANEELESFSYSVSHDLRAPLRHVMGYVNLLMQESGGQLSDKAHRYVHTIREASQEMGRLIDDLLSFSRMGRTEMEETPVDVDRLVEELQAQLEVDWRGRDVHWKIPPLPAVIADPAMLRQVFLNLLGNSLKYTRPRKPAVIEVGCAGREEDRVVFYVRDNGVGFDPRYAHKLFGVFQRLHHSSDFEGTGIGLANVRRIIARHRGRTWAEGQVDGGATIYFTLRPAAPDGDRPRPTNACS